jgi:hypothetical protein
MGLGLSIGNRTYPIGTGSFFNAFFSTICVRLEGDRWGSRFPVVMKHMYAGRLEPSDADAALLELDLIQAGLQAFAPKEIVWDFRDRSAHPPWGDRIAPTITSLGNYFVTSDGKDLIDVLRTAIEEARRTHRPAIIE